MKIGVFDSGYGGLTILQAIRKVLPQYDYIYLGDNARAPYGTHSFEVIYRYTLQAVRYLFDQGCTLVILACNTASAKALRTIQQCDLPAINNASRKVNVLGVIRPTVEAVPTITQTGHVGILATPATVSSESYVLELAKISEAIQVAQQACPLWVPIIEAGEHESKGADFFVDKYLQSLLSRDPKIDTLVTDRTMVKRGKAGARHCTGFIGSRQPGGLPATTPRVQGSIIAKRNMHLSHDRGRGTFLRVGIPLPRCARSGTTDMLELMRKLS